ncbi:hypothetical protein CDL15_Pgr009461 [Punica granatum]|uniref:Uncharacterized protein n=1 Tax=Punica granatum TaxID=22663 RepID=A0A218WSG5_PUNGR|nr:hypothetical protein CDL15_Pgr009461 [Punica granatum]PKI55936.1 hypothetical protein CRG98_023668 [Punica granatum]
MASSKAEKSVGSQLFGQAKKEPAAKASDGGTKSSSKAAPKKAAPKPQEPKKKLFVEKNCRHEEGLRIWRRHHMEMALATASSN